MNTKTRKTLKSVRNHLPAITVGAVVGAAVAVACIHKSSALLVIPKAAATRMVREGGGYSFKSYGETFYLIHHVS